MRFTPKIAIGTALMVVAVSLIYLELSKDDAAHRPGDSALALSGHDSERSTGAGLQNDEKNHRLVDSVAGPNPSDDQRPSTKASRQRTSGPDSAEVRTQRHRDQQASARQVQLTNGGVTPDVALRVFKENFPGQEFDRPSQGNTRQRNPIMRRPNHADTGPEDEIRADDRAEVDQSIVTDNGETEKAEESDVDRSTLANDANQSEQHDNTTYETTHETDPRHQVVPSIVVKSSTAHEEQDSDAGRVMTTFKIDETPDAKGRVSALIVSQRVPPGWQITQSSPAVSSFDERSRVAKWLLFAQPGYGESITYNSEAIAANASVEDWDYAGSWYTYRDPDTVKTVSFQTIRP